MRRLTRRLLLLVSLALVAAGLSFCVGPPTYYRDKYAPAVEGVQPAARPTPIVPEVQTEPHTCGLHAISAVYTAYGLDPLELRLRFRLGTDKPLSHFIPDSIGTIHPDMLRVLAQDGFETELLRPGGKDAAQLLREHLDAGHPALALTKPGTFHWVVVAAREGENATICDSLRTEPCCKPLENYLQEDVYSLLLVKPAAGR